MASRPNSLLARRLAALANLPQSAARPTLWSTLLGSQIPLTLHRSGSERIRSTTEVPLASRASIGSSSSSSSATTSVAAQSGDGGTHSISPSPLGTIMRHGEGDGVVHLDVGGKEFRTLRSTVARNRVLSELVARAEARGDAMRDGKIFIDRDPAHFGLILQHLRNEADGVVSAASLASTKGGGGFLSLAKQATRNAEPCVTHTFVQLPKDKSKMQEVYAEALYFCIDELRNAACYHSFFIYIVNKVGATKNPFDFVSKLVTGLRRGAITIAGLSAGASTMQSRDIMFDALPNWLKTALLSSLSTQKEENVCQAGNEGFVETAPAP